jgi:hypothetical protein
MLIQSQFSPSENKADGTSLSVKRGSPGTNTQTIRKQSLHGNQQRGGE